MFVKSGAKVSVFRDGGCVGVLLIIVVLQKQSAASLKLQATSSRLQAASLKLQAVGCKLQASSCKPQAESYADVKK